MTKLLFPLVEWHRVLMLIHMGFFQYLFFMMYYIPIKFMNEFDARIWVCP